MKQEVLAIETQNVYSGSGGTICMDNVSGVENAQPTEALPQRKLAETEEVAREVRKGINEFTKEVARKRHDKKVAWCHKKRLSKRQKRKNQSKSHWSHLLTFQKSLR